MGSRAEEEMSKAWGIKSKVLRTFRKSIIPQYPGSEGHVILSLARMFPGSAGSPGRPGHCPEGLKQSGVSDAEQVKAVRPAEDWFLYETE